MPIRSRKAPRDEREREQDRVAVIVERRRDPIQVWKASLPNDIPRKGGINNMSPLFWYTLLKLEKQSEPQEEHQHQQQHGEEEEKRTLNTWIRMWIWRIISCINT